MRTIFAAPTTESFSTLHVAGIGRQASTAVATSTMLAPLWSHQHAHHTSAQHSLSICGCSGDGAIQGTPRPRPCAAGSAVHQGLVAQRVTAQSRRRSALLARRAQDAPATADRATPPAEQAQHTANGNGAAAHVGERRNGSHADSRPPHPSTGRAHSADTGDSGAVQHENGSTFRQVEQYGADQTRRRPPWYRYRRSPYCQCLRCGAPASHPHGTRVMCPALVAALSKASSQRKLSCERIAS